MCSATSRNAANTPPLYHHRSATTSSDEFLIWFRLACLCVFFLFVCLFCCCLGCQTREKHVMQESGMTQEES
jgi:hypothetical protein